MAAAQHSLGKDCLWDGVTLQLGRDSLRQLFRVDLLDLAVGGGGGVGGLKAGVEGGVVLGDAVVEDRGGGQDGGGVGD